MNHNSNMFARLMGKLWAATSASLTTIKNVSVNMNNAWEDFYNDLLNEQGAFEIGIYKFMPSDILKALDPVAYDQGLLDFEDMMLQNAEEEI